LNRRSSEIRFVKELRYDPEACNRGVKGDATRGPNRPRPWSDEEGTQKGCKHAVLSGPNARGAALYHGSTYGLLAGGSRERLEVWQFCGPLYLPHRIGAMAKTLRWVTPGAGRLLTTHRTAIF
jgi:hypothetical protein